ncbi:MAG: RIP metalloprotease RseP [bacterium]|nr:RIP metalloprotease RseP [bacterium]
MLAIAAGDFLFKIGAFIIVIGLIVLVHEWGHFIAARSVGIRVIRFSIGFPPKLFSWRRKGTDFQIGMIPFGGYVKMAGIVDESMDDEESAVSGAPDEFMSKNVWQKTWVISAGVIMNLVFAWLVAIILAVSQGKAVVEGPIIGGVQKSMPADSLGLTAGDRILAVENSPITTWDDLTKIIHATIGKPLTIEWLRGTDTLRGVVTPLERALPTESGGSEKVGLIGISPKYRFESIGLWEGVESGHRVASAILMGSLYGFKQLFTGQASVRELVGPIGIVQLSGETAKSGLASFWGFIVLISISVGIINILPFPVLDGGHLVMIWIEAIRRKPISIRVKLAIQQVGIVVLLMMLLFVSYHDVIRIWSGD